MPGVGAFDQHVEEYEAWFERNTLVYRSELQALRELVPAGADGVEIGIGTGRFAAPLGIRRGVEPSAGMRRLARERGLDALAGVGENLPYADGETDFALMVTTVCFLDDIEAAFREVRRVVKPGGLFLLGFVDKDSAIGRIYQERKQDSLFYRDAVFYSVQELTGLLRAAGFHDFRYRQTLFGPLADLWDVDEVREGHGQGSFVVIAAR